MHKTGVGMYLFEKEDTNKVTTAIRLNAHFLLLFQFKATLVYSWRLSESTDMLSEHFIGATQGFKQHIYTIYGPLKHHAERPGEANVF